MRKGFVPPLILAIVAIVLVAVGAIAYFQFKPKLLSQIQLPGVTQPKTSPTPSINSFEDCARAGNPILETYPRQCKTPDGKSFIEMIQSETANWKTYISPHKIFNLKYPPSLFATSSRDLSSFIEMKDEGVLSTKDPWNTSFASDSDFRIEFFSRSKKSSENLTDFIVRNIKEQSGEFYSSDYIPEADKKEINVDGQESLWYLGMLGPAVQHIEVYIPKGETEVIVVGLWDNSQPPTLEHQRILEKILSTFQFID